MPRAWRATAVHVSKVRSLYGADRPDIVAAVESIAAQTTAGAAKVVGPPPALVADVRRALRRCKNIQSAQRARATRSELVAYYPKIAEAATMLTARNAQLAAVVDELAARNRELAARIDELARTADEWMELAMRCPEFH